MVPHFFQLLEDDFFFILHNSSLVLGETVTMKTWTTKCLGVMMALFFVLASRGVSEGADPSFEITKKCRANIKLLRDALLDVIKKDPTCEIPRDLNQYRVIYDMILTSKYLPKQPELPTTDCAYFLLYQGPKNFDWFCDLHGVLPENGNTTLTFPYHEFEFTAYFQQNYMSLTKYKSHYDRVMRWTGYVRTLSETIKYNYTRNPVSTIVMCIFGVCVVFFLYRNIFD